ncbi:MAG TPA: hypothetical protein VG992_00010 [Candidatus Saccharimonadales bacterium]|nr:hypothetical protein [Candidatus Saccharimonadales bacterium]
MYSLIVLGLVPGTNLSISFGAWLVIVAVIVAVGILRVSRLHLWARVSPVAVRQIALPAACFHRRLG